LKTVESSYSWSNTQRKRGLNFPQYFSFHCLSLEPPFNLTHQFLLHCIVFIDFPVNCHRPFDLSYNFWAICGLDVVCIQLAITKEIWKTFELILVKFLGFDYVFSVKLLGIGFSVWFTFWIVRFAFHCNSIHSYYSRRFCFNSQFLGFDDEGFLLTILHYLAGFNYG